MDGHFSGDPHPGNILVRLRPTPQPRPADVVGAAGAAGAAGAGAALRDSAGRGGGPAAALWQPVLLDWGLAKTLGARSRLAISRLVCGVAGSDMGLMLEGFEEVGVVLGRFDPTEDLTNMQHMARARVLCRVVEIPFFVFVLFVAALCARGRTGSRRHRRSCSQMAHRPSRPSRRKQASPQPPLPLTLR